MYEITILSKWLGLNKLTFTVRAEYFRSVKAILAGEYHYNLAWRKLGGYHE